MIDIQIMRADITELERIFLAAERTSPNGKVISARNMTFHRSIPMRSGNNIKTIQENLGHVTAAFTLDVYGHVTEQMKREQDSSLRPTGYEQYSVFAKYLKNIQFDCKKREYRNLFSN